MKANSYPYQDDYESLYFSFNFIIKCYYYNIGKVLLIHHWYYQFNLLLLFQRVLFYLSESYALYFFLYIILSYTLKF